MDGRAFLDTARSLVRQPYQASSRSAAGRAYYALLHEAAAALRRWNRPLPPHETIHFAVRRAYLYATGSELVAIGRTLEDLSRLRNAADYDLSSPGRFDDNKAALDAIIQANRAIELLDAIEADDGRLAAAIVALPKRL